MEILRVLMWLTVALIVFVAIRTWLNLRRSTIPRPAPRPKTEPTADRAYVAPVEPDDLTLINGIGPVIQKKLYGLGITTFDQIAALTAADIDRIGEELAFQGRIEREDWVEQALEIVRARRMDRQSGP